MNVLFQWSRLIANTPLSAKTFARDAARDPVKRRQRFEKEYSQLLVPFSRSAQSLTHAVVIC